MKGYGRPHVECSERVSTRAGARRAIASAIDPPIENPETCAASSPSASITWSVSAAMSSTEYPAGGTWLCPIPRLSRARQRKCSP